MGSPSCCQKDLRLEQGTCTDSLSCLITKLPLYICRNSSSLKRGRNWTFPASAKIEDIEYLLLQHKKGGNQQAGLMSSDTCPLSFVACLRVLALRFLLVSWFPSLCCTESEDSSDLNSESLYQQQPVFHFPCAPPSDPTYCTLLEAWLRLGGLPTNILVLDQRRIVWISLLFWIVLLIASAHAWIRRWTQWTVWRKESMRKLTRNLAL